MKNFPASRHYKKYSTAQQGFSLVEILVGLVIGLLATLVIMQVFSVFEGQKRTTTGAADAQTNGSIALHTIASELKSAAYTMLPFGYSGTSDALIDCDSTAVTAAAATSGVGDPATLTAFNSPLSPVIIADGGTGVGASDSITVRYGNAGMAGIPVEIQDATTLPNLRVKNSDNCQTGIAVILPGSDTGSNCKVVTVIEIPPVVTPIGPNDSQIIKLGDTSGVNIVGGQDLVCLGNWNEVTYGVNASNLEKDGTPMVSDIVNIQAQYGIAVGGFYNKDLAENDPLRADFNQVIEWVNPVDGLASGDWGASITVANRNRIKAVRVAVVARNGQMEKTAVTQPCTTFDGTVNNGPCAWDDSSADVDAAPKIDLRANTADTTWQNYRYRVFETIIPIRNVMWSKETL